MKRILMTITGILLISVGFVSAQENNQGTVVYDETVKLDIKLEGEMAHLMKDMPKERKTEKVLYFNPSASVYKSPEEKEDISMDEGSGMRIYMSEPENILFLDLESNAMTEQKEFMTRMFLIDSDIPESEWKITGKQKMILDFPCMEATQTDSSGLVTRAWFTPSIPVQAGPGKYFNLPGLILEVEIDKGNRTITARSVSFDPPEKSLMKKPRDGKKVTREEYDKIVAEKVKEMGGEGGEGGAGTNVVIRIKH